MMFRADLKRYFRLGRLKDTPHDELPPWVRTEHTSPARGSEKLVAELFLPLDAAMVEGQAPPSHEAEKFGRMVLQEPGPKIK